MSFKCIKCDYENTSINSMRIHYSKRHKVSSQEVYNIHVLQSQEIPKCKCGCGEETRFLDLSRGYTDFILGHHARINNPHVHRSAESLKEGGRKRSEKYKNGELVAWVKGKTKETDERIAAYGKKGSETIRANKELLIERVERMKENRLNGIVPTLKGDKHSQWKGGISPFYAYCHGDKRLFELWKYPKLVASGFGCEVCGKKRSDDYKLVLHVHHDKMKMNEIMKMFMKKYNYDDNLHKENFEIKRKIIDEITDFHINENVSGIVLCSSCHEDEHPKLNFDKNKKLTNQ